MFAQSEATTTWESATRGGGGLEDSLRWRVGDGPRGAADELDAAWLRLSPLASTATRPASDRSMGPGATVLEDAVEAGGERPRWRLGMSAAGRSTALPLIALTSWPQGGSTALGRGSPR